MGRLSTMAMTGALCVLVLAGCAPSGASSGAVEEPQANAPVEPTKVQAPPASPAPTAPLPSSGAGTTTAQTECTQSALGRSQCMIRAVLRDVQASYPHAGGGGISSLRQVGTDSYAVSIAQEERQDVITYELDLDGTGRAVIEKRTESTRSMGR